MIAEITSPNSLYSALAYNIQKVQEGQGNVLYYQGLSFHEHSPQLLEEANRQLEAFIPSNTRVKNMVFHCSLNPHPDEVVDDKTLSLIAREYMERMGYGGQPFIVFKHTDIAREHIHIVSLRVDSEGKKINDSHERRRSQKIVEELERKYQLKPKSKVQEVTSEGVSDTPKTANPQRGRNKQQIVALMHDILKRYRFQSITEMNLVLEKHNLLVKETKRSYRGKQYQGLVYTITDAMGKPCLEPLHASKLGRGLGHSAINKHFARSKEESKPRFALLRGKIDRVLKQKPTTPSEFVDKLREEEGVEAILRINAEGRLYGVSYLSEELGIATKASRIGKAYSANSLSEQFERNQNDRSSHWERLPQKEEQALGDTPEYVSNDYEETASLGLNLLEENPREDLKEKSWQRRLRAKYGTVKKRRVR